MARGGVDPIATRQLVDRRQRLSGRRRLGRCRAGRRDRCDSPRCPRAWATAGVPRSGPGWRRPFAPTPDPPHDRVVVHYPSRVDRQQAQQLVLGGGEIHLGAAYRAPPALAVDFECARDKRLGDLVAPGQQQVERTALAGSRRRLALGSGAHSHGTRREWYYCSGVRSRHTRTSRGETDVHLGRIFYRSTRP